MIEEIDQAIADHIRELINQVTQVKILGVNSLFQVRFWSNLHICPLIPEFNFFVSSSLITIFYIFICWIFVSDK